MEAQCSERKLAAILSADVKGHSRLMGADEEGTLRTLTAYREEMDAIIRQHRGRMVGSGRGGRNHAAQSPVLSGGVEAERENFKDQAVRERLLNALRKAGLK